MTNQLQLITKAHHSIKTHESFDIGHHKIYQETKGLTDQHDIVYWVSAKMVGILGCCGQVVAVY